MNAKTKKATTTTAAKKAPVKKTTATKAAPKKKPLEGKEVDSLEDIQKRKEETGQTLVNQFVIKPDPTFPSLFRVHREKGNVPGALKGMYTSEAEAKKAMQKYVRL